MRFAPLLLGCHGCWELLCPGLSAGMTTNKLVTRIGATIGPACARLALFGFWE